MESANENKLTNNNEFEMFDFMVLVKLTCSVYLDVCVCLPTDSVS